MTRRLLVVAVALSLVVLALPTSDVGFDAVEAFESTVAVVGLALLAFRRIQWGAFVAAALMLGNFIQGVWQLAVGDIPRDDWFVYQVLLLTMSVVATSVALWWDRSDA